MSTTNEAAQAVTAPVATTTENGITPQTRDFTREELVAAKEDAVQHLLRPNGNVVGVGIGKQLKGGIAGKDCVRVYVVYKIRDQQALAPKCFVPSHFGNQVPTDVIEVGRLGRNGRVAGLPDPRWPIESAAGCQPGPAASLLQPGAPIRVKTNAPNVNEGARGTLGCVVTDGTNQYILSCNHILRRNGRVPADPEYANVVSAYFVGDQPVIAGPRQFVPLNHYRTNLADCGLALVAPGREEVQPTFPGPYKLTAKTPSCPVKGMKVVKFGAVTGLTKGNIVDADLDLFVDYSFGTFRFTNQVLIECGHGSDNFATAGDSGSIVIDEDTKQAVAMIFAASGGFAVACPLDAALKELADKAGVGKLELVIAGQQKETASASRSI